MSKRLPQPLEETYHTYFSVCNPEAYEKWGGLDDKLLIRHIFTMGIEPTKGVGGIRGRDNKVYQHALLVISRDEIGAELPVLIPEVTDGWLHKEEVRKPWIEVTG